MLLPDPQIQALIQAFLAIPSVNYLPPTRDLLLRNISPQFVGFFLPVHASPGLQLASDLQMMNAEVRLADGSVPLQIWLTNFLTYFGSSSAATPFKESLSAVTKAAEKKPAVSQPTLGLPFAPVPPGGIAPVVALDDLATSTTNFEKIIFRDDSLPYPFLEGGARVGPSVVKLVVPRFDGGQPKMQGTKPVRYNGTGWLIAPDLIITNHHVVNARNEGEPDANLADYDLQALGTACLLDFNSENEEPTSVPIRRFLFADPNLDYCLLEVNPADFAGRAPLRLAPSAVKVQSPDDQFAVNIVQHPGGAPKRVAIRNNLVYLADQRIVRYFADTQPGSSGSPVFDDLWRVVALHHSSTSVSGVQFQGRDAIWVNQGTQIQAILQHIADRDAAIRAKIAP